jgi:hypothetical protein
MSQRRGTSRPTVDESLIAANLSVDPAERLRRFAAAYKSVAELARKAASARRRAAGG